MANRPPSAEAGTELDAGYLRLTEAAERLGVSEPTLRRRVRAGLIPTFSNPRDHRSRLVRIADLIAYAQPRSAGPGVDQAAPGQGRAPP